MPKKETTNIQEEVVKLGQRLGFDAEMEVTLHQSSDIYAPRYDVVWFLNLTKYFDFSKLIILFGKDAEKWMEKFRHFPFAGFEIEGSTTSSKNQVGNFANLYSGDFLYRFVIVNNEGAGNENDTYRRGLKLNRYFLHQGGYRNTFFMDSSHLEKSIKGDIADGGCDIKRVMQKAEERGKWGGETKTVPMYEKIKDLISDTGMVIAQNWQPDIYSVMYQMHKGIEGRTEEERYYLKNLFYEEPLKMEVKKATSTRDSYYVPRIDVVLGFAAPSGFVEWLKALSKEIKGTIMDSPILYGLTKGIMKELFVPLISIEIEGGESKHQHGGIFNMSKNSYVGILVTEKPSDKYIEFYRRELGINNVVNYCIGGQIV